MHLYCPTCQASFAAVGRCPRCEGRLVTPAEAFESVADLSGLPPPPLKPTALARAAVGSVVALGLYFGLREWAAAAMTAVAQAETWETQGGFVLAVVLRVIGVLVGGAVAGAGRSSGASTGFLVGVVCGAGAVAVDAARGAGVGEIDAGVVAGLAVVAAVAGFVGSRVWPPAVELPNPITRSRGSSLLQLAREDELHRAPRPTKWLRILAGAAAVVLVVVAAESTRSFLKKNTGGYLQLGGPAQAPVVCLEIAGVFVILASTVAAAGTGAGIRHGLLTGTAAGLAVAGLTASGLPITAMVVEGVLRVLDMPFDNLTAPPSLAAAFGAVLLGCTAGGWLGGVLLPPVSERRARSSLSGSLT